MKYNRLGSSDLQVSRCCLGTMTWGKQNTQEEAFEQLDYAIEQGINLIDTAELYAIPSDKSTYGATEKIIGNWFANRPNIREKVILMTKIAGPGLSYIRNKGGAYTAKDIMPAVDASLKRLQTDYIDVYQLHWPNRSHPHFGRHGFGKIDLLKADSDKTEEEFVSILEALNDCIKAGKIRHCGLSDETAWGIDKYVSLAKKHDLPKMVSIQNEFSLVHTKDYPYVIESSVMNDVAYLPWSPLGAGVLSGKYLDGQFPEGSRWTLVNRHGNFRDKESVHNAVRKYADLAQKYNMTPSQLSLAWCNQHKWVTSTIIGATKMSQLKDNIAAFDIELSEEALEEIYKVHREFPMPY